MAFVLAKTSSSDAFILETGLGGRLDATNVIPTSMAIITDIGLDHMPILGHSISDIAKEKAGIIKPNAHVVTHLDHSSDVLEVIKHAAKSKDATLHWAPPHERFQDRNKALITTALSEFFDIDPAHYDPADTPAPFGRLSYTSYHGTPCWMDVGHNAHAATAILNAQPSISEWIIGMTKQKDIGPVLDALISNHQTVRLCEYNAPICHHFDDIHPKHRAHVSPWKMGDNIQPNSLFFGSFTFIEALLHEAPK